jgi:membrane-associated phospholipid phosphatase
LKFLKSNAGLFFIIASWFLVIAPFLVLFEKTDIHLYINQHHHPVADIFFKYATRLAEGIPITIVLIVLILSRFRMALATGIAFIGSAVITQILKRFVFDDHYRPAKVFESVADLHLVDGVSQLTQHSFPSGHSTAAFALFTMLGLISKSKFLQVAFGLTAIVVAYSRMYLSQHFLEDVFVGGLIGFFCSTLVFIWLSPKSWGNRGLIALIESKLK